ncbi:TPA: ATP-binding protein [Bacillus cereus]|uniref:histidine kinase n=2 Tax=Bacillus TaxID=1386 RepID=A0AAN0SU12_BACCE|nr:MULTISPECIES: HAMP domain-containing sensor histidine kinase [Bacillus cereus group]AEW56219.1 sensor histidine kinase [Bacillus cereus F837/76]AJI09758.1 HAMP domain protein [Bacillus cereus 03BB108]EDX65034.1 sensory transduction protein kinase [Bacillus cereus 03BB108]MCC2344433.1 HAMP domain-containing histidine kinase [Bacillus anthracis]MCU4762086.1 HAMP domain-containing histidine kinase [Bacillus cereus]
MIDRTKLRDNIFFSTRLNIKLILIFLLCFIVAVVTFFLIAMRSANLLSYNQQIEKEAEIRNIAIRITNDIQRDNLNSGNIEQIIPKIESIQQDNRNINFLVLDYKGQIIYQSHNFQLQNNNPKDLLQEKLNVTLNDQNPLFKKFIVFVSPVLFQDGIGYVMVQSENVHKTISPAQYNQNLLLALVSSILIFILLFLLFMIPITRYIKEIERGIQKIVKKDWKHSIRVKGKDELSSLAYNINWMASQLRERFEKERAIEKGKSEFITNISHDLRTPLTSIIGYLALINEKQYRNKKELEMYIQNTYNLTLKLKTLINELFEYTKLSLPDVKLRKEKVELGNLLSQLVGEYIPIFEKQQLIVELNIMNKDIWVWADIEKLVRVFDNLLSNTEKYSFSNSTVIVELKKEEGKAFICITNKTDHLEAQELSKMFEKFYRVDKSRSSQIHGSGIGLAIVKRTIELHEGEVWAKSHGNSLTIHVELQLLKNV